MGWSYALAAGKVFDKWTDACVKNSGSQNQFTANGKTYFFETSRIEHRDGAITGSIWRYLPDGVHVRRCGSLRINGDGTIARAPRFLKDAATMSQSPS